jgi:hypothetical protein
MREGRLAQNIATAAVVIALQMTATMMSLRREPLLQVQGYAISGMLWKAVRHRTEQQLSDAGGGSSSTSP